MPLRLDDRLRLGLMGVHAPPEPGPGPWLPGLDGVRAVASQVERCGLDSLWVGDHLSFTQPILDPLLTLAQVAAVAPRLQVGTCVYLLPLRHPAGVAKQVATLDHLSGGRLIFGVGVGGEFAQEFNLAGVPLTERGARMTESIAVLRALWSGRTVSHQGRFFRFTEANPLPPPRQPGGPPLWCGGRSDAALHRAGRLADGWISYVVTPEMYRAALDRIGAAADEAGRGTLPFGTGHLLFARLDATPERALDEASDHLSRRYGMNFRKATQRYAALGQAQDVAAKLREFHAAGARHIVVDLIGTAQERPAMLDRFAGEVLPLLADLRAA